MYTRRPGIGTRLSGLCVNQNLPPVCTTKYLSLTNPASTFIRLMFCAKILPVQTLGLASSTPRTEGRLKSLFWPSIQTGSDVDYLGAPGYWVCALVALFSLVLSAVAGHAIVGVFVFFIYYLGGVGVRERSRYAAAVVLVMYVADMATTVPGVVRVVILGLLLSNLRATWIASRWKPESDQATLPPRLDETWSDKFVDRLPMKLWPKVRVLYYVLSACLLVVAAFGLTMMVVHRPE